MVIRIDKNDIRRMVREAVEKILTENVFIDADKVNRKQKTVGLTYTRGRGKNPVIYWDRLKTDKVNYPSLKEGASGSPAEGSCFIGTAHSAVVREAEAGSPQA